MKENNSQQQPLEKIFYDLDTQMNKYLTRNGLTPKHKVKLCHQILQHYIVYTEKLSENRDQVLVREKKNFPESEILRSVMNQHKKGT